MIKNIRKKDEEANIYNNYRPAEIDWYFPNEKMYADHVFYETHGKYDVRIVLPELAFLATLLIDDSPRVDVKVGQLLGP